MDQRVKGWPSWWGGGGCLDDEVPVVRLEQAGTAPAPEVRAGQADLVEPVDHFPDRVPVGWTSWAMAGTRFPPADASSIIACR